MPVEEPPVSGALEDGSRAASASRSISRRGRADAVRWTQTCQEAVFYPWDNAVSRDALEAVDIGKTWNDILVMFDPDEVRRRPGEAPPPLARSVLGTHAYPRALDRTFDSARHPRFNLPHDVAEVDLAFRRADLEDVVASAEARSIRAGQLRPALEAVREVYRRAAADRSVVSCHID